MLTLAVKAVASNSDQSWNYVVHYLAKHTGVMLRANIRRNAYDHQSYGRVEAYDPAAKKWNIIGSIPFGDLACGPISYTAKTLTGAQEMLFERDADRLIALGAVIIQEPGSAKMPHAA